MLRSGSGRGAAGRRRRCVPGRAETSLDDGGHVEELYGIGPAGAALIRPDGFVAWRADSSSSDPETVLTTVLTQVLAR